MHEIIFLLKELIFFITLPFIYCFNLNFICNFYIILTDLVDIFGIYFLFILFIIFVSLFKNDIFYLYNFIYFNCSLKNFKVLLLLDFIYFFLILFLTVFL